MVSFLGPDHIPRVPFSDRAPELILAFEWIVDKLTQVDQDRGHRAASKLADSLNRFWDEDGTGDPWKILGGMFNEKKGKKADRDTHRDDSTEFEFDQIHELAV